MRWIQAIAVAVLVAGAAIYLRDPPWIGGVTSGLRGWDGPPGERFRWTSGHASFFVPSDTTAMTLPLKAVFPSVNGDPVSVDVSVDDRWLATVKLPDPSVWVRQTLPLPRRPTPRRFRRIDLRVSRTVGQFNRGVQLGEIGLARGGASQ
jgi:hypothetical protein